MRARSLKPGFFKNEVLGSADPLAGLLFAGLWALADRAGRLDDRPKRIKGEVFPYRDGLDIEPLLQWLTVNGFITRYLADGVPLIQVVEFSKHQRPHIHETASYLPPPASKQANGASQALPRVDHGKPLAVDDRPLEVDVALTPSSLTPDSGLLTPHSLTTPAPTKAVPARARAKAVKGSNGQEPALFAEVRDRYPKRRGSQRWGDALKFYGRRLSEGTTHETIMTGVDAYAAHVRAIGWERTEHVQQAATFLGDNRGFLEDWSLQQAASNVRRMNGRPYVAPPTADEIETQEITRGIGAGKTDEQIARECGLVPIDRIRQLRRQNAGH